MQNRYGSLLGISSRFIKPRGGNLELHNFAFAGQNVMVGFSGER